MGGVNLNIKDTESLKGLRDIVGEDLSFEKYANFFGRTIELVGKSGLGVSGGSKHLSLNKLAKKMVSITKDMRKNGNALDEPDKMFIRNFTEKVTKLDKDAMGDERGETKFIILRNFFDKVVAVFNDFFSGYSKNIDILTNTTGVKLTEEEEAFIGGFDELKQRFFADSNVIKGCEKERQSDVKAFMDGFVDLVKKLENSNGELVERKRSEMEGMLEKYVIKDSAILKNKTV